ncbi:hypothetical protein CLOM_g10706 [Closterium sp. NIES-68]|nr:hypothetical protein CLOM_g10706 [Closterium sp. NIES-68]GJP69930.1 hypothetical protein CLOP_g926 [Closterium sp. NIES-67]
MRDFEAVLLLSPHNHNARAHLAQALLEAGRSAEAVDELRAVMAVMPQYWQVQVVLGQALMVAGHANEADEVLRGAMGMDARNADIHRIYANFQLSLGHHHTVLSTAQHTLSLAPSDIEMRFLEACSLHAMGRWAEAVLKYNDLMSLTPQPGTDPGKLYQAFYQRELAQYMAGRQSKPLALFRPCDHLGRLFNEAWSKRLAPSVLFPGYELQRGARTTRTTGDHGNAKAALPELSPALLLLLGAAERVGALTAYDWHGFLPNTRQYRMAGLAMMDIRDLVRHTWQRMADKRASQMGEGVAAEGSGASEGRRGQRRQQREQQERGEEGKGGGGMGDGARGKRGRRRWGETVAGWREVYDRVVRWRQLAEPSTAVVWLDRLSGSEQHATLDTPLMNGQSINARYSPYYNRTLQVLQSLLLKDAPSENKKQQLAAAGSVEEVWAAVGADSWAMIPCHSTATPGMLLNGTRISLSRTPTFYRLSINVFATPARILQYDHEMDAAWKALCAAYLDSALRDSNLSEYRHRIHRAILTLTFYWYQYGPLTRGTAMVGYVTMLGLFLAADMQVTALAPRGLQVDWEGILSPHLDSFIAAVSPWLVPSIDYDCPILHDRPSVPIAESLPSLLHIIHALSYSAQPAPAA